MGFKKAISVHPKEIHGVLNNWTLTKKMVFTALMAALATILQAAGELLPGIGYLISPLTTAPILLCMLLSFAMGISGYLVTVGLLLLLAPSELIIFPFTTGLLGLTLGWTFRMFNRRISILFINGCILLIGICIPLYGFGFLVFGSSAIFQLQPVYVLIIFIFSLFYSELWLRFGMFFLRKVKGILR